MPIKSLLLLLSFLLVAGWSAGMMPPETERMLSEVSQLYRALMEKLQTQGGFRNCREVREVGGATEDGVYVIYPYDCCPQKPVRVWCNMKTEGGGWTVVQRRHGYLLKEDFGRSFLEYALGFGDPEQDHWLGLDHLHALLDQTHNAVRIEMTNSYGNVTWAEYGFFYVADRVNSYTLQVRYHRGTAGDALGHHSGAKFLDMDMYSATDVSGGGWWHTRNRQCNLNGSYRMPGEACRSGIFWHSRGGCQPLKATTIMIRPNF